MLRGFMDPGLHFSSVRFIYLQVFWFILTIHPQCWKLWCQNTLFYAKQKTTRAVNRTGNTTQACSFPFIAFLQGRVLEQFVHLV